jgi:hypothetical protein
LIIRAPSHEAAASLAERLSFTLVALRDGQLQGCWVVVAAPSADVVKRTLSSLSNWLQDCGFATVVVEFDGSRYVMDAATTESIAFQTS